MGVVSSPEVLIVMNKKLKPIIALIVVVLFVAQGCAGRSAHPVTVAQSGDTKKSCKVLRKETQQILKKIHKMVPYIKKKDKKKVLKMVTGALIIIPWFFVDMKDAEKVEANALRERYNYLADLADGLNCRFKAPKLKRFYFHHEGHKKKS